MPDSHDYITPRPTDVPPADGHTLRTQHGRGVTPAADFADTIAPAAATMPEATETPAQTIAGYEVLGELGRGGMGVVYKARQKGLGRLVALKMILHAAHAGPEERARFEREAKALAGLRHEGIVQIYEVGEHEDKPFISLEYIEGGSLDNHLKGTPLPPKDAGRLVQQLADAVHSAHAAGIVHRDLKPANVLLAVSDASAKRLPDGRFCEASLTACLPKITDFGLAKKQDEGGLSVSGEILGTPSYMAPEQAAGKGKEIDARADVYALGAILYECLTGRPPFKAATAMDTLLQVMQDEPVPVRSLQPAMPQDLETIALKCLHKERERRYDSAAQLADDLGRYLRGEPVLARPVGPLERGWRWCRRNTAVAFLLAAVVVLLVGGATVSTWFGLQARERARDALAAEAVARDKADREREARQAVQRSEGQLKVALAQKTLKEKEARLAEANEKQANAVAGRRLYASQLSLAQRYWQEGNAAAARDKLEEAREHRHTWEHRYLHTLMNHRGQRTFPGHTFIVTSVGFSPDGKRIASASYDKTVKVWDVLSQDTGLDLLTLKGHAGAVWSVCFSPDGRRLASAGGGAPGKPGELKIWDAASGREVLSLTGHTRDVRSVCFSPDGQRLASGSYDGTVKIWDAFNGRCVRTLRGHTSRVWGVSYSPDGKRLASASGDKTIRVWDAHTGQQQLSLKGHAARVTGVAFSPDGSRLASASWDNTVRVWDASTGRNLLTLKGSAEKVSAVCFSPDGKRIASAGWDNMLRVWDAATGEEVLALRGHGNHVEGISFSPDGTRLASGGNDNLVKVWDALAGQTDPVLKGHAKGVSAVALSPDGRRLASASHDRTVKLWDTASGREILSLRGHTDSVSSVCFSPNGKRLASGSWDKTVKVWDAHTGQTLLTLQGHTGQVRGVCFSPDGKQLASASIDSTVRVWDAHTGQGLLTLEARIDQFVAVVFSQ